MAEKKYERTARLWAQNIQWDRVQDTQPQAPKATPQIQAQRQPSAQLAANNPQLQAELRKQDAEIQALSNQLKSGKLGGREAGYLSETIKFKQMRRDDTLAKISSGREIKTTVGDVLRETVNAPVRGAYSTIASGVSGLADYVGAEKFATSVREGTENFNKKYGAPESASQNALLRYGGMGGEALGSTVPYLAGGAASVPVRAAVGAMAFGGGVEQQDARVKQAREQGLTVSSGQEMLAETVGGVVGLTELLPVKSILARVPNGYGQKVVEMIGQRFASTAVGRAMAQGGKSAIGKVAGDAIEEGVQEAAAGVAQDLIELGVYNPNVEVGQSALQDFALGGFAGGVLGGVKAGVDRYRGVVANDDAPDQQRASEDNELFSALTAREGDVSSRPAVGLIEDQSGEALRGMGSITAGGMSYTPEQVLDIARNNESNPRIANIMSQPVNDATKIEQVARILNQEEAGRVEPEAVRRISNLVGGTIPTSKSRQFITDELTKIGDEVVEASATLRAIRDTVTSEKGGKQFVGTLRGIVENYSPPTKQGESFLARPLRTTGPAGSVVMTPDQVTEDAMLDRENEKTFRMSDVRQQRFDTATGTGSQREDLRAGAPEPEAQFFLNPKVYGESLGGIAATIVGVEGDKIRIQYESPTEQNGNGDPVIISEDVDPSAMFDRVVRGTPRMSQELAGDVRKPRRGTGTDLNPRNAVDRTSTRALVPAQEAGLPATISPTRMTGFEANTDQLPVETQNAQANPQQEPQPNVEGIVQEAPALQETAQLPAPAQAQLPPPAQRALPAPEAEPAQPTADEEAAVVEDEDVDVDNDPRMVEHNQRFDDAVESIQDAENATDVRKLAKKMIKQGLIDEDAYADIDERMKDVPSAERYDEGMSALEDAVEQQRDTLASDIEDEIYSEADERAAERGSDTRYSGRTSKRKKRTFATGATPTAAKSEATPQAEPATEERAARPENTDNNIDDVGRRVTTASDSVTRNPTPRKDEAAKKKIDYDAVIKDRLDKLAARGGQGKIVSSRLRSLLKENNYNATQVYYAFQMGEVVSRVLPTNSKVDVLFVPSITATDGYAAAASGIELGAEASGAYRAYALSQNGFRGLITLSLSDNLADVARENAAHEAFHVIQDFLQVDYPELYNAVNSTFYDGMRIKDLDPSVLRKLKTLKTSGEGSVYDSLIESFGDTPLSGFEAQAVAFGALVDAKDRGVDMKGLKASFIRYVDFLSDMLRGFRNMFRKDGVQSVAEIFEGFRTGETSALFTGEAPLAFDGYREQYSGRRRVKPVASKAGKGVAKGNVGGFEASLRVKVSGATLPQKALILTGTTNNNAARQIAEIDGILDMFPNAATNVNEFAGMMAYALNSEEVPIPPYRFIKEMSGSGMVEKLRGLSEGQINDASTGFENAREFRRAYINGELDEVTTGKLFLWSFLSRGISPYVQESMFIDSFDGIDKWIRMSADGKFDKAASAEYLKWADGMAPAGSGLAGAGAKSNLNSFGKDFLFKMGRRDENGVSNLRRLHKMMADPEMTGREIRRQFATFGEGVGIDNKVVSFTLLVAGFNDVMVLDRVQIRQLWDDGQFSERNLYDGYKVDGNVVTGSGLAKLGDGVRGILVYEAIERALEPRVAGIYAALGRPQDASVGRFHWETWVVDSQQEASHATLEAVLKDAKGEDYAIARVAAKQGEYGSYEYGAQYGVANDGNPYYLYNTPDGRLFQFDVPNFRLFLNSLRKKGKSGVTPAKFKVTDAGNQPWYNGKDVDRGKIREYAEQFGTEVQPKRGGEAPVRGTNANQDSPDSSGPDAVSYSGRTGRRGERATGNRSGKTTPLAGAPNVGGGPIAELVDAAEAYAQKVGINLTRQSSYADIDEGFSKRIADAFDKMENAPNDPAVREAYADMIRQTRSQYDTLVESGFEFTFFDTDTDPYGTNPFEAMRDLRNNKRLAVYSTSDGYGNEGVGALDVQSNPLLADTGLKWRNQNGDLQTVLANDLFRAVHDAFGHGIEGAGFRARGEENAWQAHARLYTGPALGALTSETRGQNSWLHYGPSGEGNRTASLADTVFAPQKTGLMPEWTWTERRIDGDQYSGRRTQNTDGISQSTIDKVASQEVEAGVFGKFLDKMVGRVGNESRRRALVRNTANDADGMMVLDKMLDAAIRGVDPADGRVPVDGSSVGRMMEMISQSNGVLQLALEVGPPVFDGELSDVREDIDGLFEIFKPIGEGRAEAFQTYAVSRRESDLRRRGKVGFTELTDTEIAETLRNASPDFAEVFDRYQEFNGAIIDYAIDTGYLDADLGAKFKDMDYVPYYRAYEQDDGSFDVLGPKMQSAINNPKSGLDLKLKGGGSNLGNLYENIIRNTQSIISASRKNLALQEAADAVDALSELGIDDIGRRVRTPEGEGIMRLRVEGKPVYYKIEDPAVWFAIAGLGPRQMDGLQSAIRPFTQVLRMGITLPLSFTLANLWRGKISTYVTTDANLSLGIDTFKGMKDAFQNGEATTVIKANTGMGGYDYGMDQQDFANEMRRRYRRMEGGTDKFKQNFADRFKGFIAIAEKVGEASEFAERVKLYNDVITNGGSKKTAAYEAMNLTNFGRKGAGQGYIGGTLKYLIPMIPFLNARIQGLYRIAENQQNEETILGLRKKVLVRGMLYTAISSAIYAAMSDDERWESETAEAKMLYDIIYIGDQRIVLPRPFEVGTIFGSFPIAMYDYVRDRDGKEASKKVAFAFVNTFALNPVPPAVLTAGELASNYSVFRGSPIDTMADQNLPKGMRYDERTSTVAKTVGGVANISPKKIDYAVNGYLGTMGSGFLSGIDSVLSGVGVIPKKSGGVFGDPYGIADTIASASGITRFVKDADRAQSRFVRDFYELKKEADQANRAYKKLIEEGRREEALEYKAENKYPIAARKQLGRISKQITKVNKEIDKVEIDPKLTPAEKQLKLRPLLRRRKELARNGYNYARGARMIPSVVEESDDDDTFITQIEEDAPEETEEEIPSFRTQEYDDEEERLIFGRREDDLLP